MQGAAAPGGGNYASLGGPVFNGSGQAAFTANLGSFGAGAGIYAGAPGSVQLIATHGAAAPAGGNYDRFSSPALNGAGQVAFRADLSGGSSSEGIFAGTPGSLQAVALQGDATPAGGTFTGGFFSPVLNNSGQVAFNAGLTGGSATSGIFVGAAGSLQAAALRGAAAPAGGNYNSFFRQVLNDSGQIAFAADLIGGSATSGVFVGTPGAIRAAALQGTAAPGGGTFATFNNPTLNNSGQVAFTATLAGTGVTASNDRGLFAGSADGVVAIVREGDSVDVDPSAAVDLRVVSGISFLNVFGGQDGSGVSFTDFGLLAYTLNFTDGSAGVFTTQLTPVPEPAGLLAVAAAGLALIRRRHFRHAPSSIATSRTP